VERTASLAPGQSFDDELSCENVETSSPKKVGRFHVRQVLGSGSFGTVYRAYDPLLDREVALKVPRFTSDDPKQIDRFLREAKAAARLRHENIVAVFECGVVDEMPFIATEFVDGTPLSETFKQGDVDIRKVVDLVRQIADAIHYGWHTGVHGSGAGSW
jgi:serine/threonine-protein kinase